MVYNLVDHSSLPMSVREFPWLLYKIILYISSHQLHATEGVSHEACFLSV